MSRLPARDLSLHVQNPLAAGSLLWLTAVTMLWAQPAADGPAFEVASVRVANAEGYSEISPFGANTFTASRVTLSLLIQIAYGAPTYQIEGAAKLGSGAYDIAVKAEDGVSLTYQELQPRLRRLLEERFQLAVHRESKQVDGYHLAIAKDGPKLKPLDGPPRSGSILRDRMILPGATIASLAVALQSSVGRPVGDRTGIEGEFDIRLEFAPVDDPNSPLPSIFTGLQEQLGLKLENGKVDLEMLVIDRATSTPAEN